MGETLTAVTGAIADAEGLSNVAYSYQWLAGDAEIANASGSPVAGTDWSDASRGDGSSNIYTHLNFTPATSGTFYIAVSAETGGGSYLVALTEGGEDQADRISAIGEQGCYPTAPTGLGTSGIAHDSVTLAWTAPDATGVTGYQVLVSRGWAF